MRLTVPLLLCVVLGLAAAIPEPINLYATLVDDSLVSSTAPTEGFVFMEYDSSIGTLGYTVGHDLGPEADISLSASTSAAPLQFTSTGTGVWSSLSLDQVVSLFSGHYTITVTSPTSSTTLVGTVAIRPSGSNVYAGFATGQKAPHVAVGNRRRNVNTFTLGEVIPGLAASGAALLEYSAGTMMLTARWDDPPVGGGASVTEVFLSASALGDAGFAPVCTATVSGNFFSGVCVDEPGTDWLSILDDIDAGDYTINFGDGSTVYYSAVANLLERANTANAFSMGFLIPAATATNDALALMRWNPTSYNLEYSVYHDYATDGDADGIVVYNSTGGVIATLCDSAGTCASPVVGATKISFGQAEEIFNGVATITADQGGSVVLGTAVPVVGGAVDGSDTIVTKYSALLTNEEEVPLLVPPTNNLGAALLVLQPDGVTLEVNVFFEVDDTVDNIHIHYGDDTAVIGVNVADKVVLDPPLTSPYQTTVNLSQYSPELNGAILDGFAYINIHTQYQGGVGELRGQVGALAPQVPPVPTHVAFLNGSFETPPVDSPNSGLAVITYDARERVIHYRIHVNVSSTITKMHIHEGGPGVNGDLVFALAGTGSSPYVPTSQVLIGETPVLTLAQANSFLSNGWYFNIHTTDVPSGELRGQIVYDPTAVVAVAVPWQEVVPSKVTSTASAIAVAFIDPDQTTSAVHVQTDAADVTALHLHWGAPPGYNSGTKDIVYPPGSIPVNIDYTISDEARTQLALGLGYFNVHTAAYPSGELRGVTYALAEIAAIPVEPVAPAFAVQLTPGAVVPASGSGNRGLAIINFDRDTLTLEATVWHDVADASVIEIAVGKPGKIGPVLFTLASTTVDATAYPVTAVSGRLDGNALNALTTDNTYIVIKSASYPHGDIRGQLARDPWVFGGLIANNQETPPSWSTNVGAVRLSLEPSPGASKLNFEVWHNYPTVDLQYAHLHIGDVGSYNFDYALDIGAFVGNDVSSPIASDLAPLTLSDDADVDALRAGKFYVNFHTYALSVGDTRGQCLGLAAPVVPTDPAIIAEATTPATGYAILNGSNEAVPTPTVGTGLAVLTYNPVTRKIRYNIMTDDLEGNVTGIHIHGYSGTKVYLGLSGTGLTAALTEDEALSFLTPGGAYINIHTTAYSSGEIAGDIQLATSGDVAIAQAYGEFETTYNPTQHRGLAVMVRDSPTTVVFYSRWSDPSIAAVHLHGTASAGALGEDASLVCNMGIPANYEASCTFSDWTGLDDGFYYVNFHSEMGDPEFRGQFYRADPYKQVGAATHAFLLDGAQAGVINTYTGIGLLTFDRDSLSVTGSLWYNNPNAISVTLASSTTSAAYTIAADVSAAAVQPLPVSVTLTPMEARDFLAGNWYVSVPSASANADVRGAVTVRNAAPSGAVADTKYTAVCSQAEEVPPAGTATDTVCGAFIAHTGNSINFTIFHDVTDVTLVHLHYGASIGGSSGTRIDLTPICGASGASPCVGSVENLEASYPGITADLTAGAAYVNIHSTTNPSGDTRGQVAPIAMAQPLQASHVALLDGDQETPPSGSSATGTALLHFDPTTRVLMYSILLNGINTGDITKMHIHTDMPLAGGGNLEFALAGTGTSVSPANPLFGETPPLTVAQAREFIAGEWYFNIHTTAYPSGEVRGQIVSSSAYFATTAQGWQEVPTPVSTTDVGLAIVKMVEPSNVAEKVWVDSTDQADLKDYHWHYRGAVGVNSGDKVVLETCDASPGTCSDPLDLETYDVGAPANVNARAGQAYINIHTTTYTSGELRGQFEPLRPLVLPTVAQNLSYAAPASGLFEVPPSYNNHSGIALATYDTTTGELVYEIWHDIPDMTYAHVHNAPAGTNGGPADIVLCTGAVACASPIIGRTTRLSASLEAQLLMGNVYFNLHSSTYTSGALRAQLALDPNVFAGSASGGEEVPPVYSTDSAGVMLTVVDSSTLEISIWHNIPDIKGVHLHNAGAGLNGAKLWDVSALLGTNNNNVSPLKLTVSPTANEMDAVTSGLIYANFHTWSHPSGGARAQVQAPAGASAAMMTSMSSSMMMTTTSDPGNTPTTEDDSNNSGTGGGSGSGSLVDDNGGGALGSGGVIAISVSAVVVVVIGGAILFFCFAGKSFGEDTYDVELAGTSVRSSTTVGGEGDKPLVSREPPSKPVSGAGRPLPTPDDNAM